jgi:hypothetical protein
MFTRYFQRLLRGVLFILIIGWAAAVSAGTRDPNTPDEKYVEFGKKFTCVTRLRVLVDCDKPDCPAKSKEHDQFGSAVIIRGNWLLTAAHVVHNSKRQVAIKADGQEYPLQHVIIHKDFADGNFGYHDLALGYSPKDFGLDFYCPLYADHDELGKAITIAGFGVTGTFQTGGKESDGQRRAGHNKVSGTEKSLFLCTPRAGRDRFPLEFMIAPGDSGGGAFIGSKLAGINSCLLAVDGKPDGTYTDESAFTRISIYADWIERQIEQHELALRAQATTGALLAEAAE